MTQYERSYTLNVNDRIEELEQSLSDVEERRDEIVEIASQQEKYGSDLEEEYNDLEARRVELQGELQELQWTVENYGGGTYKIRKLKYGDLQRIQDQVTEESLELDIESENIEGVPREGRYKILVLRESIVDQPADAPTREDGRRRDVPAPGKYEDTLAEWMYEKVNSLNTTGSFDMGNLSLDEAISQRTS
jgi:hypothetical protein